MESEQIDPLDGVLRLDLDNRSNAESVLKNPFGAATINPNKDDDRRLFQECRTTFSWDSKLPYSQQPNPIDQPTPLLFPDHFLQVEGSVVVIYWGKKGLYHVHASFYRRMRKPGHLSSCLRTAW